LEGRITSEKIISLNENEVFVFGSNLSGKHGKGAAKTAMYKFGAKWGQGAGLQGKSYGIPTKNRTMSTLSVDEINYHVRKFIKFAKDNPQLTFLVTEIGCGLARFSPKQIAPLFKDAANVPNIHLPKRFWEQINK
jgi:hypothetical protein